MQQYSFLSGQDIADAAKAEAINSTTSQITAIQDTQILAFIENLEAKFAQFAHTRHTAGGWSWMKKTQNFQTVAKTTLNGALSSGGASVVLTSASNFDSSGRIAIETSKGAVDFVDYTSKASNTLTVSTVSGAEIIGMTHATGERVEKMYALPSDYAKTYRMMMNDDIEYMPIRDGVLFPPWKYFTQYGAYILFPRDIGAQDFTHYYVRKHTTLAALSTETDIPKDVQRWAIEMTLFHLFRIRRKRSDIVLAKATAEENLAEFLQYDQTFTAKNASRGIRTGHLI